jgi:hypothetical protein
MKWLRRNDCVHGTSSQDSLNVILTSSVGPPVAGAPNSTNKGITYATFPTAKRLDVMVSIDNSTLLKVALFAAKHAKKAYDNYQKNDKRLALIKFKLDYCYEYLGIGLRSQTIGRNHRTVIHLPGHLHSIHIHLRPKLFSSYLDSRFQQNIWPTSTCTSTKKRI